MKIFNLKIPKNIFIIAFITIIVVMTSCAYFNTFYNATLFFDEAEQMRAEYEGERLSSAILNKYEKVIEKSDIVIAKYDDSRYLDDAYFLKGKSHFYRGEYDDSEFSFKELSNLNSKDYGLITEYWISLIKWKKEKPQPALNDLNSIIQKTNDEKILAQIYKSIADIYLEIKKDSLALIALENAAELTKDRNEKGNIYFQLAELADKIESYDKAISNYEKVVKYSFSNEKVMESHLRIVQRYRDLKRFKKASNQIQSMLNDPEFNTIYADLNLELAKLQFSQNDNESAIVILNQIVIDFPKTEVSAEAFFLLGEQHLLNIRDFEKADYYYQQIQKEFSNSSFKSIGQNRLKEISQYSNSKKYLENISAFKIEEDSTDQSQIIDTSKVVLELYNLGELEAFHFNQIDTSLIYFNQIINEYPNSEMEAKSLYTLSYISLQLGDTTKSLQFEEKIITKYPDSEYTEHLRTVNQNKNYGISSLQKLFEAENLYLIDADLSLLEYKNIAKATNSEASKRSLLFIANEYENKLFNADSALKYYELLVNRFPDSKQAKHANSRLQILNSYQISN